MKIGSRAGPGAELVVVSCDSLGKRVAVRCTACDRAFVVGAGAVASAHCGCQPLSPEERNALRLNERDVEARRQQREWRPGR